MAHYPEAPEVPNGENMPWFKRVFWIIVGAVISALISLPISCVAGHAGGVQEGRKSNEEKVEEAQARKEKLEQELARQKQEEERQRKHRLEPAPEGFEGYCEPQPDWSPCTQARAKDMIAMFWREAMAR